MNDNGMTMNEIYLRETMYDRILHQKKNQERERARKQEVYPFHLYTILPMLYHHVCTRCIEYCTAFIRREQKHSIEKGWEGCVFL